MIYTSYYANPNLDSNTQILVQISNSSPENYPVRIKWSTVYPLWDIVRDYKNGTLSEKQYEYYYENQLVQDAYHVIPEYNKLRMLGDKEHKDIVLLCYESPEKFCHRHILARYFEKCFRGLKIKEL